MDVVSAAFLRNQEPSHMLVRVVPALANQIALQADAGSRNIFFSKPSRTANDPGAGKREAQRLHITNLGVSL